MGGPRARGDAPSARLAAARAWEGLWAHGGKRGYSEGGRRSDQLKPILAVSSNLDRAAGRRKPNHSQSKTDPKVRQTASMHAGASRYVALPMGGELH